VIVETSAIIAMVWGEPERERFRTAIVEASTARMSAASYLEASIVVDARGDRELSSMFDQLIENLDIVVEPVTRVQADIARDAYRRYGRGSGHPAGLNFGDCFGYALAKVSGQQLLFKGSDFVHTDVQAAVAPVE
jgi:ribonuclease VapC